MKRDGLVLLGLAALFLFASSQGKASASVMPRNPPNPLNPRTGKPIVKAGTRHLSDDELRALIAKHGFADQAKAFAIAKRESGGWVDVVVDTRGMTADELKAYWGKPALPEYSVGLWQINAIANTQFSEQELLDEDGNAEAAWKLSQGGKSWAPWGG